jgi:hypothetical protein
MKIPSRINQRAERTLRRLIEGLDLPGDVRHIDNSTAFMRLSIEVLSHVGKGRVVSLAHYGEQNGDLMADPEMTFLVGEPEGVYPLTYRNDYVGVNQEAMRVDEGYRFHFAPQLQRQLASFTATWMENLVDQQFDGRLPAAGWSKATTTAAAG